MQFEPFKLERYFAKYEFHVKFLLSPSDCESLSLAELLQLADADSLARWHNLSLGYTESQGLPALRTEIAKMYQQVVPDDILIAAPEEAIFIAMHTLLKPGDHVIAISPAYQSLYAIARSLGCEVTPWQLEPRASGWSLDLDKLEQSLDDRTRLIVVNFPHNPTGYLPSRAEFECIGEVARQRGIYVFSDEMYRYLEYDSAHRLPPLADLYEKGISLSGLSKSFALPGLRLGWLATQEHPLIDVWLALKDYTTICNSAPSEILGLMALRAQTAILARNLDIIQANLNLADQFFANRRDCFEWLPPQAGSVAFPRWTGGGSVDEFCQNVLTQQEVMIVPGSIFEFPGDHFRVGLGRRNFGEALQRVSDYLKST